MCFEAGTAQGCMNHALEERAGTGAGILLAGSARPFCRADYSVFPVAPPEPEATVHTPDKATVSVVELDRRGGYRLRCRSSTGGLGPAGRYWRWCRSCTDSGRHNYSVGSTAGRWGSLTFWWKL